MECCGQEHESPFCPLCGKTLKADRASLARKLEQSPDGSTNRRFSGRLKQDTLRSSLGQVLDISAGGMRVLCRKLPPAELVVTVGEGDEAIQLKARPAWSRQVGFRKYEVGLKFVDVPPRLSKKICGLSLQGRIRRVI